MKKLIFLLSAMLGACLPLIQNQLQDADSDGFTEGIDCNDSDPTIHPGQTEPCICDQIDQDCNGTVDDFPCDLACIDNDQDGFFTGFDCNDDDASIHPNQEEPCRCDTIDHNCNGQTSDLPCEIACNDADGDGFDSLSDCNDADASINPNAGEPCICDNIDQNCSGDPQDFPCDIACGDGDGDGFHSSVDCNDNNASIHPDQEEPCVCDAIDQNCNGETSDFLCDISCGDADNDGFDSLSDCNDIDSTINPGAGEPCICDSVDQDCSGDPQDFDCEIACGDGDGDGFHSSVDCNDNNPDIHPEQEEECVCNAIDDNCNGAIDDFPCDIPCVYLEAGSVCEPASQTSACEPGLACCYPCGIEGCEDICMEPAQDGGCPLFP